jgi:hypothetical protein
MKINMDIENDVIYKYVNFNDKIPCIMGYIKIKNSDKICRIVIYILKSRCFSFLCSLKYKVFEYDFFCKFVG